ncbi:hypothetical protein ACOSP7_018927 [Xanthoceras sorbifolium]
MVTLSKPLFVTQFSLGIYATDDPKKTEHLLALDGAKQRLYIFKASLLEEGSLDSAVDGCDGVFHTASPVLLSSKVPQADIVDPALKGTLDHLMKLGFLIRLFVRNQRSVKPVLNIVKGVKIPCETYRWVDVRDVASAHIRAFENPTACGRYCLVERVANCFGIAKILRKLYPDLNLPKEYTEEKASAPIYQVSKERAHSLGITYIPPEVVCVTGASGYIASWLVKLLLQRGYTVKATVRDPNDPKKTQHLLALDGAKQRLHIFKASLSEEGAFDSAIHGCDGVFQTASPVVFSTNDPQN